jgi:hypothetical protein
VTGVWANAAPQITSPATVMMMDFLSMAFLTVFFVRGIILDVIKYDIRLDAGAATPPFEVVE